jgi:hypothetical protein
LCYLGMNPLGYQGIAQNRRLKNVLALLWIKTSIDTKNV